MNGFVIRSGSRYLDRNKKWRKKLAVEAYVFSLKEAMAILKEAKANDWERLPESLIPAIYNEEWDKTEITTSIPAYPNNQKE